MKKHIFTPKLCFFLFLLLSITLQAQDPSPEVKKKLEDIYNSSPRREISLNEFIRLNRHVYEARPSAGAKGAVALAVVPDCNATTTFCDNGDFESGSIDQTKWLGGYGTFFGTPDPASMTSGFVAGPLASSTSHQTIVGTGTDPVTGISLTPLNGGSYSLRLGNSVNGSGTELVGRTIKVDSASSTLSFWYAVVFEDPNHAPADQPAFSVRVVDCATGQEITNVCNLGNGSNKVISNSKNPFFQSTTNSFGSIVAYRNWTKAEIFLSSHIGKTVTIYFINNDCNLSGHYGYTYLDNFCSSSLFVREPSTTLKGNDEVINDIEAISGLLDSTGLNRYGISADGVTRLLIIKPSTKTLTFSLPAGNNGTLSSLANQSGGGSSVDIAPVMKLNGESIVVAVYKAPDGYGTVAPLQANGRNTTISVQEQGDASTKEDISMNIFTPPVVMIHGMWSKPAVWKEGGFYTALKNAQFTAIDLADYSKDAASTFIKNTADPAQYPLGVQSLFNSKPRALSFYKNSSIAATQVDVVAHSLGGLMTRSFAQMPQYKADSNYSKGYVHRLITLGTPHLGSELGGFLWDHRFQPIFMSGNIVPLSVYMYLFGNPIGTAHKAFMPGSDDYKLLTSTPVPTFAVVGNYKPGEAFAYNAMNILIHLVDPFTPSLETLLGGDNDVIVGVNSQRGALPIANTQEFASTVHSIPGTVTETNAPAVQTAVRNLLLSDDVSQFASSIPAPAFPAPKKARKNTLTAVSARVAGDSDYIKIVSPARNALYLSTKTDSIELEFVPHGNISITGGLFLVEGIGMFPVPSAAPFKTGFVLPKNAVLGRIYISAIASDTSGMLLGDTLSFFVQPTGRVVDFTVSPDEVMLDSIYDQQPLTVTAFLVNGLDTALVDLSSTEVGTTYTPTKGNSIVSVDSNGIVTAMQAGTDTIVVNYQGNSFIVSVNVANTCAVPKPGISRTGNMLMSSSATGNQWYVNGVAIPEATEQSYTATGFGVYQVRVLQGCSSPFSDTIQISSPPCDLSALDLGPDKNTNLFFIDSSCTWLSVYGLDSARMSDYTFAWSNGDTAAMIRVCPEKTTQYKVMVTLNGCTIEDSIMVQVEECPRNIIVGADCTQKRSLLEWNEPREIFPDSITLRGNKNARNVGLTLLGTYDKHGYYRSNQTYLWETANSFANNTRYLATLTSKKENAFVDSAIKPAPGISFWIGLYNAGKQHRFRWVTSEKLRYTNWAIYEPTGRGPNQQKYVRIADSTGQWYDGLDMPMPFIYEFEKPVIYYKQVAGPRNGSYQKPGVYTICYERFNSVTHERTACCFKVTLSCDVSTDRKAVSSALEASAGVATAHGFTAVALPNPSSSQFTVKITSTTAQKVSVQLVDITGRIIETKDRLPGNSIYQTGKDLKSGIYYLMVTQGTEKKILKLVKL